MKSIGFTDRKPLMERISFRKEGFMSILFKDGRMVYVPLSSFPGIQKLAAAERRHYHIAGGEFLMFQADDEVYHIQDFLGTYTTNAYQLPSESKNHLIES